MNLKFKSTYISLIYTNYYTFNVIYKNVNFLFKYETIIFIEIINIER